MEEMKQQEKERLKQNRQDMYKSQSQGELAETPKSNTKPFSPETRVFSPKEALNQQVLRASMNSNLDSVDQQMQRSIGFDNQLAPSYSTTKFRNPNQGKSILNPGNNRYKYNKTQVLTSRDTLTEEGKTQQALKRFEEYEKKRKKIVKRIKK
mmetsp:Transcript_11652/g.13188  ORF Transcript_11652/g.13188 Transcript_11652/m.13188 type:complete len:152 (+) Transcript_11652:44-499(+)